MAIKQYSLAKDGARQLSPAFKVREFRCRDGSDAIMVDEALKAYEALQAEGISVRVIDMFTWKPPTTPLWVVQNPASICWAGRLTSRCRASASRTWPPTPRV